MKRQATSPTENMEKKTRFDGASGQEALLASKKAIDEQLRLSFDDPGVTVNKGKLSHNGYMLSFQVEVKLPDPVLLEDSDGNKEEAQFKASALDWNMRHPNKIDMVTEGAVKCERV